MTGDSKIALMLQKLTNIESNLNEMGSQYNQIKLSCEEKRADPSLPATGGQITARDPGNETGRSLETIIVMDESIGPAYTSRGQQLAEAVQDVSDDLEFESRDQASLGSYKRFLMRGDQEQTDRSDSENILASSYQEEESSADQLQELIQMVHDQRSRGEIGQSGADQSDSREYKQGAKHAAQKPQSKRKAQPQAK